MGSAANDDVPSDPDSLIAAPDMVATVATAGSNPHVKLRLTAELRRADGRLVTSERTVTVELKRRSLRS